MATGGACSVHGYHSPAPLRTDVHHIQPRSMGGPDDDSNRVDVCPTGHFNIHTYLAWLVFGRPRGDVEPKATRSEKALARKGFDAWTAASKPGNPHGAYAVIPERH